MKSIETEAKARGRGNEQIVEYKMKKLFEKWRSVKSKSKRKQSNQKSSFFPFLFLNKISSNFIILEVCSFAAYKEIKNREKIECRKDFSTRWCIIRSSQSHKTFNIPLKSRRTTIELHTTIIMWQFVCATFKMKNKYEKPIREHYRYKYLKVLLFNFRHFFSFFIFVLHIFFFTNGSLNVLCCSDLLYIIGYIALQTAKQQIQKETFFFYFHNFHHWFLLYLRWSLMKKVSENCIFFSVFLSYKSTYTNTIFDLQFAKCPSMYLGYLFIFLFYFSSLFSMFYEKAWKTLSCGKIHPV